jgi:hypothetical protein
MLWQRTMIIVRSVPVLSLAMAAAMGAAALGLGCQPVDHLELEPSPVVLRQPNNEVFVRARALSRKGAQQPDVKIEWSVRDETIARVDASGKVTPLKGGETEVVARHGKLSAGAPVQVLYAERFTVEPARLELAPEEYAELTVKVYDHRGRLLKDRTPLFREQDPTVVRILGRSEALGMKPGSTKVEVRVDGLVQMVDVTVRETKPAGRKK